MSEINSSAKGTGTEARTGFEERYRGGNTLIELNGVLYTRMSDAQKGVADTKADLQRRIDNQRETIVKRGEKIRQLDTELTNTISLSESRLQQLQKAQDRYLDAESKLRHAEKHLKVRGLSQTYKRLQEQNEQLRKNAENFDGYGRKLNALRQIVSDDMLNRRQLRERILEVLNTRASKITLGVDLARPGGDKSCIILQDTEGNCEFFVFEGQVGIQDASPRSHFYNQLTNLEAMRLEKYRAENPSSNI